MKKISTDIVGEASVPAHENAVIVASNDDFISSRIFTIRGVQVMLSSDLALLYDVEVKYLHRQVKRNENRFPFDFVMHLSPEEANVLRCQNVTSKRGGDRYGILAFTEQGVAMLSSVLKSNKAAEVNVAIMRVFVSMRKMLSSIAPFVARLDAVERRQITDQLRNDTNQQRNEERFDTIFKAMDGGDLPPQKVFFDGKHYDAYSFAVKLVKKATKSIVLIDGYVDETTLDILSKKRGGAKVTIVTTEKMLAKQLTPAALDKFNKQNPGLTAKAAASFHDRFMILDDSELYHFGASLKDLGRKYCAVSKMDAAFIPSILARI